MLQEKVFCISSNTPYIFRVRAAFCTQKLKAISSKERKKGQPPATFPWSYIFRAKSYFLWRLKVTLNTKKLPANTQRFWMTRFLLENVFFLTRVFSKEKGWSKRSHCECFFFHLCSRAGCTLSTLRWDTQPILPFVNDENALFLSLFSFPFGDRVQCAECRSAALSRQPPQKWTRVVLQALGVLWRPRRASHRTGAHQSKCYFVCICLLINRCLHSSARIAGTQHTVSLTLLTWRNVFGNMKEKSFHRRIF